MRVLSFGEILLRLASPGYTRLFQKDSLESTFCGGEANVAVSLAMYGIDSALSESEAIAAIQEIVNTPPEEPAPSAEERIAATLEYQALSSLPLWQRLPLLS